MLTLLYSLDGANQMFVDVGTKPTTRFSVHEDLWSAASPCLKEKLDYLEDDIKVITLELVSTGVFSLFLRWLYQRRLPPTRCYIAQRDLCFNCNGLCSATVTASSQRTSQSPVLDEADVRRARDRYKDEPGLVELYDFATRYDVPLLREAIIDQLWSEVYAGGDIFTYQDMITIFRDLAASSPLRRLAGDTFVSFWCSDVYLKCPVDLALFNELPRDMLNTSISLLAKRRDNPNFMQQLNAPCHYHEHDNTEVSRQSCVAKHESTRKRKREELERAELIHGAIAAALRNGA